jgi:hypothetical protein
MYLPELKDNPFMHFLKGTENFHGKYYPVPLIDFSIQPHSPHESDESPEESQPHS